MNHQYFINIAAAIAKKSKDPSTQVGAILVDQDNRIVSTGYNGMVAGANDSDFTWNGPMKYLTVIHAEMNAILYARRDLKGCRAYITHGPCESCLKHLLQAKITEIYYDDPFIMKVKASNEQREAIARLIMATKATVKSVRGEDYLKELY